MPGSGVSWARSLRHVRRDGQRYSASRSRRNSPVTAAYYFGIAHGALATILFMGLWWAFGVLYPVLRASNGWELARWDTWNAMANFKSQEASVKWGVVVLLLYGLTLLLLLLLVKAT